MMRSIILDELLNSEVQSIHEYLEQKGVPSGIDSIYWLPLPKELWSQAQIEAPLSLPQEEKKYKMAAEVGEDWVRFELLVRGESIKNLGGGQAEEAQVKFIWDFINEMIQALKLMASH